MDLLKEASAKSGRIITPPPVPLILNGWAFTNDVEKRARWAETVDWAEKWGFSHILREITPEMMYQVEVPSSYQIGPMGGPMHLSWNFESRPPVTKQDAGLAISSLRDRWHEIVGAELSAVTRPLGLTGLKKRRLLIYAAPNHTPSWGSWTQLADSPKRRNFTRLRASVNKAIHPLMVDHIDFVHELQQEDPAVPMK
jgi:hypothetical protein